MLMSDAALHLATPTPVKAVPEEVLPSSPVGNATDPIHEAEFPGDPAQMQVQRKYCNAEGCTLQ